MLAALNTKEAHSKDNKDKYDNIPQYKIGDLVMIKNHDKKLNWDAKYIPNFRVIRLVATQQLEVSDPTGRLGKLNTCYVHKVLSTEFIVSCISDEQIYARKGKHINDQHILKEIVVIDTFLQDNFTDIRFRH